MRMKKNISMLIDLVDWSCECCGAGEHFTVTIPELDLIYSRNDQFGGKLNKDHNDFPEGENWYSWTCCLDYYLKQDYTVTAMYF